MRNLKFCFRELINFVLGANIIHSNMQIENKKITNSIKDLSKHLFWDTELKKLDFEKNKKIIISRVLDYGLINDWKIIYKYYGIKRIAEITMTIRNLDKKSVSFIASLSKIPIEKILCYTTKQSIPKHWDF